MPGRRGHSLPTLYCSTDSGETGPRRKTSTGGHILWRPPMDMNHKQDKYGPRIHMEIEIWWHGDKKWYHAIVKNRRYFRGNGGRLHQLHYPSDSVTEWRKVSKAGSWRWPPDVTSRPTQSAKPPPDDGASQHQTQPPQTPAQDTSEHSTRSSSDQEAKNYGKRKPDDGTRENRLLDRQKQRANKQHQQIPPRPTG